MTFMRYQLLAGLKPRGTLTAYGKKISDAPTTTLPTGATPIRDVALGPPPSSAATIYIELQDDALADTEEAVNAETIPDAPETVVEAPVPGHSCRAAGIVAYSLYYEVMYEDYYKLQDNIKRHHIHGQVQCRHHVLRTGNARARCRRISKIMCKRSQ